MKKKILSLEELDFKKQAKLKEDREQQQLLQQKKKSHNSIQQDDLTHSKPSTLLQSEHVNVDNLVAGTCEHHRYRSILCVYCYNFAVL